MYQLVRKTFVIHRKSAKTVKVFSHLTFVVYSISGKALLPYNIYSYVSINYDEFQQKAFSIATYALHTSMEVYSNTRSYIRYLYSNMCLGVASVLSCQLAMTAMSKHARLATYIAIMLLYTYIHN